MKLWIALGIVALIGFAAGQAWAADGAALYEANCAKCHGADGKADTAVGKAMKTPALVGADFAGAAGVKKIEDTVNNASAHQSLAGKLSADDLAAIAKHVESLGQ